MVHFPRIEEAGWTQIKDWRNTKFQFFFLCVNLWHELCQAWPVWQTYTLDTRKVLCSLLKMTLLCESLCCFVWHFCWVCYTCSDSWFHISLLGNLIINMPEVQCAVNYIHYTWSKFTVLSQVFLLWPNSFRFMSHQFFKVIFLNSPIHDYLIYTFLKLYFGQLYSLPVHGFGVILY